MSMAFTPSEMGVLANFVMDLTLMGRDDDAQKVGNLITEVDRFRKERARQAQDEST